MSPAEYYSLSYPSLLITSAVHPFKYVSLCFVRLSVYTKALLFLLYLFTKERQTPI